MSKVLKKQEDDKYLTPSDNPSDYQFALNYLSTTNNEDLKESTINWLKNNNKNSDIYESLPNEDRNLPLC